jgi:hypothetical protein
MKYAHIFTDITTATQTGGGLPQILPEIRLTLSATRVPHVLSIF